jgi:hypothetical protein
MRFLAARAEHAFPRNSNRPPPLQLLQPINSVRSRRKSCLRQGAVTAVGLYLLFFHLIGLLIGMPEFCVSYAAQHHPAFRFI